MGLVTNLELHKKFGVIVIICLWSLLLGLLVNLYRVNPEAVNDIAIQPVVEIELPSSQTLEAKYLLNGTVVWDRGVEEWSRDELGNINPEHPFEKLSTFNPDGYDSWIADLECPTSATDIAPELGNTLLQFNCRPEFLPFAAEYFDIFNLSNNHSDNSGREALEETKQLLKDNDIQFFGDPDPSVSSEICKIIEMPVRTVSTFSDREETDDRSLPIALCSWHYFFRLPTEGELEVISSYSEIMPVFAFVHMGPEYQAFASDSQVSVARKIADLGADLVVVNNPHWVQNAENYNGIPIVYSTGNFIFDQEWNPELQRSVSLDVEISADLDANLEQWLSLDAGCVLNQSLCFEAILNSGLDEPELDYAFEPIGGEMINRQQQKATPEQQQAIESRLNWEDTGF